MIKNNKNSSRSVGIIDYDCGNIKSLFNAINKLGYGAKFIKNENELLSSQKIILPGVGSFEYAVNSLHKKNLFNALKKWSDDVSNKLFGICLGMQLLCSGSDEASEEKKGLNLINAKVENLSKHLNKDDKIPHMGWNSISLKKNKIFNFENNQRDFYFVHSYAVFTKNEEFSLAKTSYQDITFDSMITNGKNIYGAQFHPEKSDKQGLSLLNDFLKNA